MNKNNQFTRVFSLSLFSSILLLSSTNIAVAQRFDREGENKAKLLTQSEEVSSVEAIVNNSSRQEIARTNEKHSDSLSEPETITLEEIETKFIENGYYQNQKRRDRLTFFEIDF